MTRLLLAAIGAIGLILLTAFVASRLVRSRTAGISIRMQIFLALAAIVGAFALGLGVLVLDRVEARATLLAEGAAQDEASALAALLAGEMEERGTDLPELAAKLERAQGGVAAELHLALLDPAGRDVFARGPSPSEPGTVFMTAPILVRGAVAGRVRVGKPTLLIRRVLADTAPAILVISTVLGAAAAAAAALIGRVIARPIESLTEFAVRVSEGERRASPPPAQGREVKRLIRALDSMRRQLEGRPFVEAFAADLSHELKNPVAAIRASAEVLADGALAEPEEAARFVARIQEATARIEALLNDLLSLARIEARGIEQAAIVDLAEIARKVVDRACERGASVKLDAPAEAPVRGDELWLTRAIENLVENALAHGRSGEPIRVGLESARDQVVLSVKNGGEIGKHVSKRLFRRFVTTRADRGGTGLGLAIVRAIAEAHSGTAECVSPGPPAVEFRISLPPA
ncbi:MAG: HAMP domain-containing protein [Polyangiaceae bacterium]|nr:HAMP domain-containing protein [Polyangiaceae bacterium]